MPDVPEMVERVARAIRKSGYATERGWAYEVHEARAAIAAMREPTPEMADAGRWPGEDGEPMEAWRAMIDVALSPVPAPSHLETRK